MTPGIEAASGDLYAVAKQFSVGPDRGARMSQLLHEAFLRFAEDGGPGFQRRNRKGTRGQHGTATRSTMSGRGRFSGR